jgi:hypothetical protein
MPRIKKQKIEDPVCDNCQAVDKSLTHCPCCNLDLCKSCYPPRFCQCDSAFCDTPKWYSASCIRCARFYRRQQIIRTSMSTKVEPASYDTELNKGLYDLIVALTENDGHREYIKDLTKFLE